MASEYGSKLNQSRCVNVETSEAGSRSFGRVGNRDGE